MSCANPWSDKSFPGYAGEWGKRAIVVVLLHHPLVSPPPPVTSVSLRERKALFKAKHRPRDHKKKRGGHLEATKRLLRPLPHLTTAALQPLQPLLLPLATHASRPRDGTHFECTSLWCVSGVCVIIILFHFSAYSHNRALTAEKVLPNEWILKKEQRIDLPSFSVIFFFVVLLVFTFFCLPCYCIVLCLFATHGIQAKGNVWRAVEKTNVVGCTQAKIAQRQRTPSPPELSQRLRMLRERENARRTRVKKREE